MNCRFLLFVLLLCGCLSRSLHGTNVVFILADDMGFGDVEVLNPDSRIPTPNLNRLALGGMTFTDAHSPSAVCTPTRYGVVTGRYCWRGRLKSGVLNGYGEPLIEPGRETVASFLAGAGYHTGVIGKWHLGLGFVKTADAPLPEKGKRRGNPTIDFTKPLTTTPNSNGFHHSYVIPASLDFPPYVYIENDRVTDPETVEQPAIGFPGYLRAGPRAKDLDIADCLHHLTRKVGDHLKERAAEKKPFFLYFPLTAPHKPATPHPDFVGKSGLGLYGDFIMQVDWTIGEVLDALDENGLTEDTLVIYTSDNGSYMYETREGVDHLSDSKIQGFDPGHHRANGKLRGTKADIWEAGHRVPFFARWPKVIEPATVCRQAITHTDLFATCADIVGKELPEEAAEDSFSWLPLFKGEETNNRPPVINHSASGMFAIRDGRWKLIAGNGSGGREAPKGKPFERPYVLIDVAADLGEKSNLIEKHPEVAAELEKQLDQIRKSGRSR